MSPRHTRLAASAWVLFVLLTAACTPIEYEDHWMDSPLTEDPSLSDPSFRLSTRLPEPSPADLDTPVIVAVHGFGASTYEMVELRDYAEDRGAYVSLVLLGGHGRSIDAWVETDERDWGAPIVEELKALDALGYRDISVATTSTGGTLLVRALADGELDGLQPLRHLLFVAPFIVSADDRLYVAPILGPILNNVPASNTELERELWYTNRPAAVFNPLMRLLTGVESTLQNEGIDLPASTEVTVWLGDEDPVVSPRSVALLREGLRSNKPIRSIVVRSRVHPHTRGIGRALTLEEAEVTGDEDPIIWGEDEETLQLETFGQMLDLVMGD
jgi:carboxylesterase